MSGFNLIALFSAVLKPTDNPREQGKGGCVRGENCGTVGQALVIHGSDLMVLNTAEGDCVLALAFSASRWCVVWNRMLLSTLGLVNFWHFLFHFLPCCLSKS